MSNLTIDELGNAIQNFLSSQYSPVAGATSVFVVQPGGLPVDASMFASNLLLAAQEINDLADVTARVLTDQFYPTLIRASGLYEILLSGLPTDAMTSDQLVEFGKLRSNADADYHNQTTGITTIPSNWWDITANRNWTTHTTSSDSASRSGPVPIIHWNWHVLPLVHTPILKLGLHPGSLPINQALDNALAHSSLSVTSTSSLAHTGIPELKQPVTQPVTETVNPTSFAHAEMTELHQAAPVTESLNSTSFTHAEMTELHQVVPVEETPSTPSFTAQPISMIASQRAIAQLVSVSSTQVVEAEHISVSFEYCPVTLSRAWWDELFVASKGWYIPTYGTGDLSMGASDGSDGQCPAIPTAMFLVRNVTISGSWSEQDRTVIPSAASFGPISLLGRSIDSNLTISIPGMQIVGWMADILPVLPPMSDPNLSTLGSPSSSGALNVLPTLSSGQQGPSVARLQGLLRAAIPGSTDAVLPIDGDYGPITVSAVQTFQQQNGIHATGLVDETTWQKLLGLS